MSHNDAYEDWFHDNEADLQDAFIIKREMDDDTDPNKWDRATMSDFLDYCWDRWVNCQPDEDPRSDR